MDAYVVIASKRDTRGYSDKPVPPDLLRRILEAGRVTGNAMNKQDQRFVVLGSVRERAADSVTRPSNLLGCQAAVAVVVREGKFADFDAGRISQSMMLGAWNEGVASCPNAIADHDQLAELIGLEDDERVAIIISLGYPASGGDPERRSADEWLAGADRAALEEMTSFL